MSSRLFINIREREGLCYYVSSHIECYSDCGYLGIKAGVDNKRTAKAVELITKELIQIREGVTAAELKKAKDFLRGKLALNLETSSDLAFWVGGQELVKNKIRTPKEILKEIGGVTVGQIRKVAQEVIRNQGLNLVVIGPFKDQKKFTRILHF